MSPSEFISAYLIFEELGLIKVISEKNLFGLQVIPTMKNDLLNSKIYNYIINKNE